MPSRLKVRAKPTASLRAELINSLSFVSWYWSGREFRGIEFVFDRVELFGGDGGFGGYGDQSKIIAQGERLVLSISMS